MTISKEDAKKLVKQQQIAHKLLAGFYQNILSMFNEISESCDMGFRYWGPRLYNKPCAPSKNPNNHWIWDMFPLYASQFGFFSIQNPSSASAGDKAMHIELHCDGGYKGGNMAPLSIESSDGHINIMLYKCTTATASSNFNELYDKAEWPDVEHPCQWQDSGEYLKMYYTKYELADFISNFEAIQDEIKSLMTTA